MGSKAKDVAVAESPAPLFTIEALFERHGLAAWQRRGLMVHAGWAAGKSVTEDAFQSALAAWRQSR
jgi:hypothetical protein